MALLVLGTDTDAGKTSFALLWLAAFQPEWQYWKPIETGGSDSETVRRLLPAVTVHPALAGFRDPVAPPLAARREHKTIPSSEEIARSCPLPPQLLIETFGGPFSPMNEDELQVELIQRLGVPTILVSSTSLGCIGRTLAVLMSLGARGIVPALVVLIGPLDEYAQEQIGKNGGLPVFSLYPLANWDTNGLLEAARNETRTLESIRKLVTGSIPGDERSEIRWDDDRRHIWHPYTSLQDVDAPLPVGGVRDEFLFLADGRRLIDAISSWWTILHGHRDPLLMNALNEAAQSFDHVLFAGATHPPAIRVAELLLQSVGWNDGRVFFSDNGSTAVEVALKMAYQYWCHREESQRILFVGFENGYHGDTFGAMAVGRDPLFFGRFEPLLFHAERVPVSADRLDALLERHAGRVAAVVIEPLVQGAGGMRMHSAEELRALFDVTRKHRTLFIADEVMTGCHRTGTMWAYQSAGIEPDLVCAAKTLAGGILSLAATIVSPEIVGAFDVAGRERTFFHGHSFTAHPLACAIAAKNLSLLKQSPPAAPERFQALWNEWLAPLRRLSGVREVRIRGTIAAVEMDLPGGYLAESARVMRLHCLEQGVFLRPLGNVLYAMPPFNTGVSSLRQIANAMIGAVELVLRQRLKSEKNAAHS